ncbi:uncharacterized protein METZ01_LOCUS317491 [marine metagenome]|uniref:Uncharacterized protein n=1 Tax=marine metagenome TaxID=408172 RepID=A0A382NW23_9ZZZZ
MRSEQLRPALLDQVKPTAQAGSRRENKGHQVWRLVQHL